MIKIKQLSKRFKGVTAVDDISFEVGEGESLVLLGTSGCGKTTTLKMINRLVTPSSGRIEVNGKDVMQQPPEELRRAIGYVIQNIGLFPHYTIEENIAVIPKLLGWGNDKIRKRTQELVAKLHLSSAYLKKFPSQLSGGQQQRIGLARALVADPPIILMDEPLGALDPLTRGSIRREFKSLEEIRQKTMIMVTHDVHEAFDIGDRICLMHGGKIQQIGTPRELLFSPANEFVHGFLANHRFQLQLSTLTLQDVIPQARRAHGQGSTKGFPPEAPISTALEWFSTNPQKNNEIVVRNDGSDLFICQEALMAAFYATISQMQYG